MPARISSRPPRLVRAGGRRPAGREYCGPVRSGVAGSWRRRWRSEAGWPGRGRCRAAGSALAHLHLRRSAGGGGAAASEPRTAPPVAGAARADCRVVPATILDGKATAAAIRAELTERVAALAAAGHRPGPRHPARRRRPGQPLVRQRQAHGLRRRSASPASSASCRRPPTQADVAGGRRGAQRRPGVHRLHRPAAAAAAGRRVRRPRGDGPGQGRRRAAPGQPRPARAQRARAAAVHAGRHRRAAAPLRRPDRRRRGRRHRPRDHRRPAARAAAHPPLGERDRDAVPHRHPRPGRARAHAPTSSSPRPACPG